MVLFAAARWIVFINMATSLDMFGGRAWAGFYNKPTLIIQAL